MTAPKRTILHNGSVILPDRILWDAAVLVEGERIADVRTGPINEIEVDESVNLNGRFLAPGLIDMHIHGAHGVDVMVATADDLAALSRYLLSRGVTRYLPTTVPLDEAGMVRVIEVISHYIHRQPSDGAQVMGIHFEGPFVNPNRCGALHPEHFRTFTSPETAAIFLAESLAERLPIRMMTLAPEMEGGLALIEALAQRGYVVSVGHSQAPFEVCDQAAAAGARHVTHFPNALAPLHHRQPGVFGWALLRRDITLDVIADGHHVDWRVIELIRRMKSSDAMALISDAIAPAGLGDGQYHVWGETIWVCEGRTQNARGALAGSIISLWDAVQNLHQGEVPLTDIIRMASLVPARILRIDSMVGSVEKGKRADLICFDAAGTIHFVWVNGRLGYSAG